MLSPTKLKYLKSEEGAGEVNRQLRELSAHPEDLSLVPTPPQAAHNRNWAPGNPVPLSSLKHTHSPNPTHAQADYSNF